MKYALPFLLLLGACQMQSPPPVYTAEEAEAHSFCQAYAHSDFKLVGYEDPMAACMEWRIRTQAMRK